MAQDIVAVTSDLYRFLLAAEALTPRRPVGEVDPQALLTRAQELAQRIGAARAHAAERIGAARAHAAERFDAARAQASDSIDAALDDASRRLKAFTAELAAWRPGAPARLKRAWAALGQSYEALRAAARDRLAAVPLSARPGAIKPRNYARNLFHVVMALSGVLLYEFVFTQGPLLVIAGVLLAGFVALDVGRRLSPRFNERLVEGVFGKISRPGEAHEVPAATWYLAALFLVVALFPQTGAQLGTLILGVGDPAASLAGKRWGRLKLFGQKSWAGTLTFFGAAGLTAGTFLLLARPDLTFGGVALVACGAALAGALAELFTGRLLDDNFTIPLAAGAATTLLLLAV